MEPGTRHSTSPEDYSEGNDTLSAPSEFLAEFLSAIMRRQYAEALKYCRLILQYEPHNATARGFYPLLQHKVTAQAQGGEARRGAGADDAPGGSLSPPSARRPEYMQQEADSSSQSSLELDSSEPAHSSPSLSLSRRTDHTDSASGVSGASGASGVSGASSASGASGASGARWESSPSRSEDDNGNAPLAHFSPAPADIENDNAATSGAGDSFGKGGAASLRRLRAHFACSIK